MFLVQAIHLESGEVENTTFDLVPKVEQAEKICRVFGEWLAGQPSEFRERIPFLTRGDMELEWTAASDGVAFAALIGGGEPLSVSVLLAGINAEADNGMLEGLLRMVPEDVFTPSTQRPLLATLLFPGAPEAIPTVQLLTTALASVFFRTVLGLNEATSK